MCVRPIPRRHGKHKKVSVPAPHESINQDIPIDGSLSAKDKELKNRAQQILGATLWLSIKTRPDLCYAHSRAASYVEANVHAAYQRSVQILLFLRENPFWGTKV